VLPPLKAQHDAYRAARSQHIDGLVAHFRAGHLEESVLIRVLEEEERSPMPTVKRAKKSEQEKAGHAAGVFRLVAPEAVRDIANTHPSRKKFPEPADQSVLPEDIQAAAAEAMRKIALIRQAEAAARALEAARAPLVDASPEEPPTEPAEEIEYIAASGIEMTTEIEGLLNTTRLVIEVLDATIRHNEDPTIAQLTETVKGFSRKRQPNEAIEGQVYSYLDEINTVISAQDLRIRIEDPKAAAAENRSPVIFIEKAVPKNTEANPTTAITFEDTSSGEKI
jgi:hypothetical protein